MFYVYPDKNVNKVNLIGWRTYFLYSAVFFCGVTLTLFGQATNSIIQANVPEL